MKISTKIRKHTCAQAHPHTYTQIERDRDTQNDENRDRRQAYRDTNREAKRW